MVSAATTQTSAGKRHISGVDLALTEPIDRVKHFLSFGRAGDYEGFDIDLIQNHLIPVSAALLPNGSCTATFKFVVPQSYCNRLGNLHGGAAATIFDIATTTALAPIARLGHWQYAGVTRSLSVQYMRPAPCGLEVEIVCTVVNAGRRLTTISGEIRSKGKILMTCEHLKVQIDPPTPAPAVEKAKL